MLLHCLVPHNISCQYIKRLSLELSHGRYLRRTDAHNNTARFRPYVDLVNYMLPYMGEEMEVYRVLLGKPEGRRPLGRPRRRWVDNIRMDLQEVGCGYMDWPRIETGGGRL